MASNKRQAANGKQDVLILYTNQKKTLAKNSSSLTYLPAMDTGESTAPKRNTRLDITKLFDARVAATTERVDPLRAKANAALKDVDNFEVEKLSGKWGADTVPQAPAAPDPENAPLLTLRQLMPGSTGDQDDDRELDNAFRADRIEFILL